jgi:hypothetical protein
LLPGKEVRENEINRNTESSKENAPTIFQVLSSRAIAFRSILSSFSARKGVTSDFAGFFSGLFLISFSTW